MRAATIEEIEAEKSLIEKDVVSLFVLGIDQLEDILRFSIVWYAVHT